MKPSDITHEMILRFIRQEASDEEAKSLLAAMEKDPLLKEEYETLKIAHYAFTIEPPPISNEKWESIEKEVFATLLTEQDELPAKQAKKEWKIGWMLAPIGSLAIILVVLLASIWSPSDPLPTKEVKPDLVAKKEEKVFTPYSIMILQRRGLEETHISDRGHGSVSKGDSLITGADGALKISLNGDIEMTMFPDTRISFVENEKRLIPHLEQGAVEVHVTPGTLPRFRLSTDNTLTEVLGTRFIVETSEKNTQVSVIRGTVQVGLPNTEGQIRKVSAGRVVFADSVGNVSEPVEMSAEQRAQFERSGSLFEEATVDFVKKEIKPVEKPTTNSANKDNLHTQRIVDKPVGKKREVIREQVAVQREIVRDTKGWDSKLAALSPMERNAIQQFFSVIDYQMNNGFSIRAIRELNRYIERTDDFSVEKAHFLLGECHFNLQEYKQAENIYSRYHMLYPHGLWHDQVSGRIRTITEIGKSKNAQ